MPREKHKRSSPIGGCYYIMFVWILHDALFYGLECYTPPSAATHCLTPKPIKSHTSAPHSPAHARARTHAQKKYCGRARALAPPRPDLSGPGAAS
eukprot:3383966-Prymnesium_polylepis.1